MPHVIARSVSLAGLLVGLLCCGCGGATTPTEPGPPPSPPTPSPVPATVYWRISLGNVDGVSFGLRMRLDGETIYENRSAQTGHVVELERRYVPGSHRIEFHVLQATRRRSTYQPHYTIEVKPTGPMVYALGVPRTLAAGESYAVEMVI